MEPTLYIIMRSDIQDGNPGKMMAQAAHAQAEFDEYIADLFDKDGGDVGMHFLVDYAEWTEGRAFGRTIVLSATEEIVRYISSRGTAAGLTIDPTYPWRNYYGELQITSEATCAWLFLCDETQEDAYLVEGLPLHR